MPDQHVEVVQDDLTDEFYRDALESGAVAWDIETSGLDWTVSSIGTCQVALPGRTAIVVMRASQTPKYLAALLEEDGVTKVFHHAPFDLRFLSHYWNVKPSAVACTKIASKVLDPSLHAREHSLKPVLRRHLGIEISKDQQVSDWLAAGLTREQVEYAAADVAHLLRLFEVLVGRIRDAGLDRQLQESYRYLPTRVSLDLRGAGDVFSY